MQFDGSAFLSGLSGILAGGGILLLIGRYVISEMRELRNEVKDLKETRLVQIEKRIEKVEMACVGTQVMEKLGNALGWLKKIDLKLDAIGSETAEQRAQIVSNRDWIRNVDVAHNQHVRDRGAHHG